MTNEQLDLLAKDTARLLLGLTSKMSGNPEILARGYVVDAVKDTPKVEMVADEGIYGKSVNLQDMGKTVTWKRYVVE